MIFDDFLSIMRYVRENFMYSHMISIFKRLILLSSLSAMLLSSSLPVLAQTNAPTANSILASLNQAIQSADPVDINGNELRTKALFFNISKTFALSASPTEIIVQIDDKQYRWDSKSVSVCEKKNAGKCETTNPSWFWKITDFGGPAAWFAITMGHVPIIENIQPEKTTLKRIPNSSDFTLNIFNTYFAQTLRVSPTANGQWRIIEASRSRRVLVNGKGKIVKVNNAIYDAALARFFDKKDKDKAVPLTVREISEWSVKNSFKVAGYVNAPQQTKVTTYSINDSNTPDPPLIINWGSRQPSVAFQGKKRPGAI